MIFVQFDRLWGYAHAFLVKAINCFGVLLAICVNKLSAPTTDVLTKSRDGNQMSVSRSILDTVCGVSAKSV